MLSIADTLSPASRAAAPLKNSLWFSYYRNDSEKVSVCPPLHQLRCFSAMLSIAAHQGPARLPARRYLFDSARPEPGEVQSEFMRVSSPRPPQEPRLHEGSRRAAAPHYLFHSAHPEPRAVLSQECGYRNTSKRAAKAAQPKRNPHDNRRLSTPPAPLK